MAAQLCYRGISYDPQGHERLSDTPVDHIYRGHHYSSAPRHLSAPANTAAELRYRGIAYHHQRTQG